MAEFGEFEGEEVKAVKVKVSGTRGADRIIHRGETVYFLAKLTGGAAKHDENPQGDLVREMFLTLEEFIECPSELSDDVKASIIAVAEAREGVTPLPLDGAE